MVLKRTVRFGFCGDSYVSLSSDSSGQLDVFRHDSYSSGMDGTEIGVLEQPHLGMLLRPPSRASTAAC